MARALPPRGQGGRRAATPQQGQGQARPYTHLPRRHRRPGHGDSRLVGGQASTFDVHTRAPLFSLTTFFDVQVFYHRLIFFLRLSQAQMRRRKVGGQHTAPEGAEHRIGSVPEGLPSSSPQTLSLSREGDRHAALELRERSTTRFCRTRLHLRCVTAFPSAIYLLDHS